MSRAAMGGPGGLCPSSVASGARRQFSDRSGKEHGLLRDDADGVRELRWATRAHPPRPASPAGGEVQSGEARRQGALPLPELPPLPRSPQRSITTRISYQTSGRSGAVRKRTFVRTFPGGGAAGGGARRSGSSAHGCVQNLDKPIGPAPADSLQLLQNPPRSRWSRRWSPR